MNDVNNVMVSVANLVEQVKMLSQQNLVKANKQFGLNIDPASLEKMLTIVASSADQAAYSVTPIIEAHVKRIVERKKG